MAQEKKFRRFWLTGKRPNEDVQKMKTEVKSEREKRKIMKQ